MFEDFHPKRKRGSGPKTAISGVSLTTFKSGIYCGFFITECQDFCKLCQTLFIQKAFRNCQVYRSQNSKILIPSLPSLQKWNWPKSERFNYWLSFRNLFRGVGGGGKIYCYANFCCYPNFLLFSDHISGGAKGSEGTPSRGRPPCPFSGIKEW